MKLLLTLDGSKFAESAIPLAQRLAEDSTTEVHLLAVAEPITMEAPPLVLAGEHYAGALAHPGAEGYEAPSDHAPEMEFMLGHYLEMVARLFPRCTVCPVVRVGPYPAAQIAAYAESNDIDLIVMATHGRSGIGQLVYGSVAGQVLRAGVALVALVKPSHAAAA